MTALRNREVDEKKLPRNAVFIGAFANTGTVSSTVVANSGGYGGGGGYTSFGFGTFGGGGGGYGANYVDALGAATGGYSVTTGTSGLISTPEAEYDSEMVERLLRLKKEGPAAVFNSGRELLDWLNRPHK